MLDKKKKIDKDATKERILEVATKSSIKLEDLSPEQSLRYNILIEQLKLCTLVTPDIDTLIDRSIKAEIYILTGKKPD